MEDLYIVIESFDPRNGYEVKIHGVFTDKEKAKLLMKDHVEKVKDEYDNIEEGEDFYNLNNGEHCDVLEIKEGRITN
jgi:hypothetical protein